MFKSYGWLVDIRLECVGLEAWLDIEIQMRQQDSILTSRFSIMSSLLASFSKMLPPRGGKMAAISPTYIFSGLGPILKEASIFSTVETEVLSQVALYPYLKQFLE